MNLSPLIRKPVQGNSGCDPPTSGSFATLAAIRRASLRVNSPTARRAGVFVNHKSANGTNKKPLENFVDADLGEIKLS
jgi:hypothetical protein